MASFHSWVGLASVLVFSAQLLVGAYHFLPKPDAGVPGVTAATKAQYLPLHVTAGVLCIVLPVATSGIGFMGTLPPPIPPLAPQLSALSRTQRRCVCAGAGEDGLRKYCCLAPLRPAAADMGGCHDLRWICSAWTG